MNELVSMLVPLETLGGTWPEAPNPPVLTSLALLIGAPAVVFLIIYGIGQLSALAKAGRGEEPEIGTAAWIEARGGTRPKELDAEAGTSAPAIEGSARRSDPGTGGASGSW